MLLPPPGALPVIRSGRAAGHAGRGSRSNHARTVGEVEWIVQSWQESSHVQEGAAKRPKINTLAVAVSPVLQFSLSVIMRDRG